MTDGSGELILTERRGAHVLVITINRFHRRNAFDSATARAMERAIDMYDDDADLRCAIIAGAGGVFCSGQDLIAAQSGDYAIAPRRGGFGVSNLPPRKPLIAAVEGYALAGGLELCLSCDLIVASRDATMGLPEVVHSLVAVGGGLLRLPRRIPYHVAMEVALTGRPLPATEFHRLGLVNRLAEPGATLAAALELAEEVLRCGPLAVAASVQIVRGTAEWTEAEGWREQHKYADAVIDSDDVREGLLAFAEKRRPTWRGR